MINHFRLALIPLFIELLPRGVNRNWKRFEDRRHVSRLTMSPRWSAHCLAIAVSTVWKFNETGTLNLLICAVLPCRGFHNRTTFGKQAQRGKEILFASDLLFSFGMCGGERSSPVPPPVGGGTGEDPPALSVRTAIQHSHPSCCFRAFSSCPANSTMISLPFFQLHV